MQANDATGDLTILDGTLGDAIVVHGWLYNQWFGVQTALSNLVFSDGTSESLGRAGWNQGQDLTLTWVGDATHTTLTCSGWGNNTFKTAAGTTAVGAGGRSNTFATVAGEGTVTFGANTNYNTVLVSHGEGAFVVHANGAAGSLVFTRHTYFRLLAAGMSRNGLSREDNSMKLHWSPRSPYVRKVMVAAHELGLANRLDCVRSLAAMSTPNPAIMADNPLSKIPTLVLDDGQVLIDSTVIIEYLDSVAGGGKLLAASGPARWETLSRHALAQGMIDLLMLWRNERDKPLAQQTPAWLDAFGVKGCATLDRFEQMLPGLEGKPFDMGHVALGCALSYADFRFADLGWRTGRPGLAAWHEAFATRPSVLATGIVDA